MPFYKTGAFGEVGFVLAALLVGFGFGFFIERGGLANARKLTRQFYLSDFTVLRVMFTAIVVAMLGLLWLALLGWMDLGKVYLNPTLLWPMIAGGALVGLGFAVGGYCPGTAVVALATAKLDALVFLGGILVGVFAFGETYGWLAGFAQSGNLGTVTLDHYLGVSPAVVAFIVVGIAVLAFWGGGKLEARFGKEET
jgi:hypothetical protein